LVVAKHHRDLYSALGELQKEQVDCETMFEEFRMGRTVSAAPAKKWLATQKWLIILEYGVHRVKERVLEFLRASAHNIVLS